MKSIAVLALGLCPLAPLAAQSVHVVDDDGGADFVDLPQAIAAAAAGDVLLVKPGSYSGFVLTKSLTITAETDQTVDVGAFLVWGLQADDRVVLRGLSVGPDGGAPTIVAAIGGWVGLEDCSFTPESATSVQEALSIHNGVSVVLVRTTVTGHRTNAIEASSVDLTLQDCVVTGGSAGTAPSDGGHGVDLYWATLHASGGVIRGGAGSDAIGDASGCMLEPGNGGHGVYTAGLFGTKVTIQDTLLIGGSAGAGATGCGTASDGQPYEPVSPGTLVDLGGTLRTLDVETPVRMGTNATNVLAGVAGDLVVLAIGFEPDATPFAPWLGVFTVANPALIAPIGVIPSSGSLSIEIPVPVLPFEGIQLYEQAAYVTPLGQIVLSTASLPLVLDPSF
jgi:hypothetical protein